MLLIIQGQSTRKKITRGLQKHEQGQRKAHEKDICVAFVTSFTYIRNFL